MPDDEMIQYWLLTAGRHVDSCRELITEYAQRLLEAGIPVDRVFVGTRVLHPQAAAYIFKWERGGITAEGGGKESQYSESELANLIEEDRTDFDWDAHGGMPPFAQLLIRRAPQVRIRVEAGDKIPGECQWLVDGNYTDYIALPDNYGKDGRLDAGIAWSTKIPGGFNPEHVEFFRAHMPALSTAVRLHVNNRITETLLTTYLGRDPGSRVYAGSIGRGDGVRIRSAIWFSDVRQFTAMSNRLPQSLVIQILNTVFEVSESVIRKRGGEVLKFMGDGLMAVFSDHSVFTNEKNLECSRREGMTEHERRAFICRQARIAAQELQEQLDDLRIASTELSSGEIQSPSSYIPPLLPAAIFDQQFSSRVSFVSGEQVPRVGIGLHYGDCTYGNVGAPLRLDFTVIGPSVNLASRVESLCSELSADVLATAEFVEFDSADSNDDSETAWKNRGAHAVKGFTEPITVFELLPPPE